MKKNILVFAIIFLVSVILSWPMTKPGLHQIHDDQQIARLFLFDKALMAGQFPVRWIDSLGFGFGYPLFVFYPPFVYMLGEFFHLLGAGIIESTKLVFFAGIIFSGITMYILAKEFWGKLGGLLSALFYLAVPYRALDIYVRGALAESFAFVWLPLILWSFYKVSQDKNHKYILISVVSSATLMITHNLVFLPFAILLVPYLLFLILRSNNKKYSFLGILLAILLSLALSAFFWIPAILEKKFTIVDQLLLVNLADYKIHFVYPTQLWNWPWGFGGSSQGLADGISFKIGKIHIFTSLTTLILGGVYFIKNRLKASKKEISIFYFSTLNYCLLIFAAFMTTYLSVFFWGNFSPLGYLQFPWRFLIFTALFASFLSGGLIYYLRLTVLKIPVFVILTLLLLVPNLKLFKPQFYRPDLTDQNATSAGVINWDISSSSFEYVPKNIELYKSDLGTNLIKIAEEDIPKEKIKTDDKTQISIIRNKPHILEFISFSKENSEIRLNVFNFPGWEVKINGTRTKIKDDNRLKLITFKVPAGTNQVIAEFKNTKPRMIGNSITALSLLVILFLIKSWRKTSS